MGISILCALELAPSAWLWSVGRRVVFSLAAAGARARSRNVRSYCDCFGGPGSGTQHGLAPFKRLVPGGSMPRSELRRRGRRAPP
eukprot:2966593-Alexandrium_andersonii.AAC.1